MKFSMFAPVVCVLALLASSAVWAQQYRWIDKDGRIQYSDSVPPAWAKDVRKTGSPGGSRIAPQVSFELAKAQKDFPVTLYTAANCVEDCESMRAALNRRGVPFKEIAVSDQESRDELKQVSGALEAPTLLVGRAVQRGFEQGAVDALLDSGGYPKTGVLPPLAQKAPAALEGDASPAAAETAAAKPAALKAGRYDASGLTGPAPKKGRYGVPAESK